MRTKREQLLSPDCGGGGKQKMHKIHIKKNVINNTKTSLHMLSEYAIKRVSIVTKQMKGKTND